MTKVDGARSFIVTRTELSDGGGTVGDVGDATPQRFGGVADPLSVNFTSSTSSVLAGETVTIGLRLNRPLANVSVIDLELSGTVDPTRVSLSTERVVFAADQVDAEVALTTQGNAGGTPAETAILTLVATPLDELEGRFPLFSEPSQGPTSSTVSIQDSVAGGPPVWNFGVAGGAAVAVEGTSETYVIQLDKNAAVDQEFTVSMGSSSTATIADFAGLPQTVTVLANENQAAFTITYPDNDIEPPVLPVLRVEGSALGTAVPGTVTAFDVTIEDNDASGGGPILVNWSNLAVDIPEGETRFIQAVLTRGGQPVAFDSRVEIPLAGDFDSPDFDFLFGAGNAEGALTFKPDDSEFTFSVTATANGTLASEDFVIPQAAAGDLWERGAKFRTTLTSTLDGVDPTVFMLPSMTGNRRMIKGLVAVDPPSTQLPEYSLTTGERVHVVEFGKEATGAVSSVFVYGLTSGDESVPQTGSTLGIRPADENDTFPVEAGQFIENTPTLSFTLRAAGSDYSVATADALLANGEPTSVTEWTGPNGVWPQDGPEVVRETVYLMRPLANGVTQSLLNKSPDTLGYIELCETKIAGEDDLVLYEGYWANGAWRSTDDPDVEALAVNPYTDGEIEDMQLILASALQAADGSNWDITAADLHPAQFQGSSKATIQLLRARTEPYFFPTCQPYTFWFAVHRRGDADAKLRAEEYIRCRNVAWAVGDLGSTRKPIYGDTGDLTIDWGRANLADAQTNTTGWPAIKELGEDQQDGLFGQTEGVIQDWTGINKDGSSNGGGVFPFSQSNEKREGWHHPIYPNGGGLASGRGIYGSTAHLPWWTQWYRMRMEGHKIACRTRHFFRDVVTGRAPFWWELSEQATLGGERTTVVSGSIASRTVRNRHWHFFGPTDPNDKVAGSDAVANALRFAPTDRPWNTPPSAGSDPQKDRITGFETFHNTHMPRERSANNDGWWGMRSFLSYRMLEARAASITRVHMPIRDRSTPLDFSSDASNLHGLVEGQRDHPEWQGRGTHLSNNQIFDTGAVLRAYGWNMIIMAGFYSVAAPFERLALRGGPGIDIDWFGMYGEVMEFIAEPTGLMGRGFGSNPTASSVSAFGDTNYTAKTGAFPLDDTDTTQPDRPDLPSVSFPYGLGFHQIFCVRGAAAMRRYVAEESNPSLPDYLRRVLEWHGRYILGKDAFTSADGPTTMPFAIIAAISPTDSPSLNGPVAELGTVAQQAAGDLYWLQFRDGVGFQGWTEHRFKSGWTSVAAMRGLDDPGQAFISKAVFDMRDAPDSQLVEFFMRGDDSPLESGMTSPNGGNRFSPLGEQSFIIPYVAELLNRIS